MPLTEEQIHEYLSEHLPYRLNCLRAWDIYLSRRTTRSYDLESDTLKCYWKSEILAPAFEISILFGRSLLNFLGIRLKENRLKNFTPSDLSKNEEDSVYIWDINVNKDPYLINNLLDYEQTHLVHLLSIANKSVAHLTSKNAGTVQLASLIPARQIIYRIMVNYVDGLAINKLWWPPDADVNKQE